MGEKMKRFPITGMQRHKNIMGPRCVECQVSGRYLQFHENSALVSTEEFITVDVMPMLEDYDKPSKRICQLIIKREDLMNALAHVTPTEQV